MSSARGAAKSRRQVFYKFRSHRSSEDLARTLSIISDGRIYAAGLAELNDPSEGWFMMAHDCEDDIETSRVIREQIRVVSLCRFYSNALLWSYYADAFSGVCLAISFPEDKPESVIYNGMDDDIWPDRHAYGHVGAACRQARRKLDYWQHEIEYRVIKVADSEADTVFASCMVHGALFGSNTSPDVKALVEKAGKAVNSDFFTDTVRLNQGWSHAYLGAGLGVRPCGDINSHGWLIDGAGPLSGFRRNSNKCFKCGEADFGNGRSGSFLEEHLLKDLDCPDYYYEENTVLLCPNCHRKAHLDPNYLTTLRPKS